MKNLWHVNLSWLSPVGLFALCGLVLLCTVAPTLYTLDSAEFAIGAAELSIVHAPGYALYLVTAHVFTWLPVGDLSYRANLFSAVCLALTAPVLYGLLLGLTQHRLAAFVSALIFMWSYYVWAAGIVAEVYAAQMLTLALAGWVLAVTLRRPAVTTRSALMAGAAFGIAVAMHPASILFAPGMVVAFRLRGVTWRASGYAALIALLIFASTLLYFPLRYDARPALNLAGRYRADGTFDAVNLRSVSGVWWLLSGQQFERLFFARFRLGEVLSLFWANYLGIGVLIGLAGLVHLYRTEHRILWVWLAFFLPYTGFYATYGAADFETMFGPSYLLWAIPVAYGLRWVLGYLRQPAAQVIFALALPVILGVINFPLLDLSHDTSVRDRAGRLMQAIPQDAVVFGQWWDIVPLQYLYIVEDQRPDLTLRNLFLFDQPTFEAYVSMHLDRQPTPIVMLGTTLPDFPDDVDLTMTTLNIEQPGGEMIIAGFVLTPVRSADATAN
jgi:hypothetical protein